MKIYHQTTRYHERTGKPYKVNVLKEIRCDFTGVVIQSESDALSYHMDYGDEDPCFGSDGDAFALGKEHGVNVYAFLSDAYHFDEGACVSMMEAEIASGLDFAQMCEKSRVATARSLIVKGIIKPEQLSERGHR